MMRQLGCGPALLLLAITIVQQAVILTNEGRSFSAMMNRTMMPASLISKAGNATLTATGTGEYESSDLFLGNEPPSYGAKTNGVGQQTSDDDVLLFIFCPSGASSVAYVEQATLSARTAGFSKRHIVIIDTSYDSQATRSMFLRNQTAYIHRTDPFDLTFSMLQNVAWRLAKSWSFPYYFWMHADVVITSAGETRSILHRALEEVTNAPPTWGVVFFAYDWFAAYNTQCAEMVRWDQGIPHYFSDCDYYNRVKLAGYSVHSAWIGNVLHMRTLLDEEEGRQERRTLMARPIEWWGQRGAYQSKNMDKKRRMYSTATNKLEVSALNGFESVGGVNAKQVGSNATVVSYVENAKAGKAYIAQKYGDRLQGKNICGSAGSTVEPLFDINENSIRRDPLGADKVLQIDESSDPLLQIDESSDPLAKFLADLPPIPKKIHLTWKDKGILQSNMTFALNGVRNLVDLNPDWEVHLSEDGDVDAYLQEKLEDQDWELIKDRHIVEKSDLWRLLKIYHEGGYYSDIDRLNNIPLDPVITSVDVKWGGHTWYGLNFCQDSMLSSPGNPLFEEAIKTNLQRRREVQSQSFKRHATGDGDTIYMGPDGYMYALTSILLGPDKAFDRVKEKGDTRMKHLIDMISKSKYAITLEEKPGADELLLNTFDAERSRRLTEKGFPPRSPRQGGGSAKAGRKSVYKEFGVTHWSKSQATTAKKVVANKSIVVHVGKLGS